MPHDPARTLLQIIDREPKDSASATIGEKAASTRPAGETARAITQV